MSAPVIKTRTISSATETAIQLSNGQFGRAIGIGTSWNTVRVGLRWHWTQDGANHTPKLFIGLCSGTSNMFGDATTTHAAGVYSNAATFTFAATPNRYTVGNQWVPAKRVGSTITTGSVMSLGTSTYHADALANAADRDIFLVDIVKGSPNFTFKIFACGTSVADISTATFLAQMEQATPAITNYLGPSAGTTLAVSEGTDGTFDTVNVSWDLTSINVEICDIAVAIIS